MKRFEVLRFYADLVIESMQDNAFDLFEESPRTTLYQIRTWTKKVVGFSATAPEIDELVPLVKMALERDFGVHVVDIDLN